MLPRSSFVSRFHRPRFDLGESLHFCSVRTTPAGSHLALVAFMLEALFDPKFWSGSYENVALLVFKIVKFRFLDRAMLVTAPPVDVTASCAAPS